MEQELKNITNEVEVIVGEINNYVFFRKKHIIFNEEYFNCLIENIQYISEKWVRNTYIGIKKNEEIEKAFNRFHNKLIRFLLSLKNEECFCDIEKSWANNILYQGTLYRYLGNASPLDKKNIEVEYGDIYVSWSKKETIHYIETKLYPPIKKIKCKVSGKHYGIDLEALGTSTIQEAEVVFPTFKKSIIEILDINDLEE